MSLQEDPEAAGQPDWNLLPHDPCGFFGLEEAFTRRDLKRAYNRLLRQFRPEQHPEEFQRIRAAYELLEEGGPVPVLPGSVPEVQVPGDGPSTLQEQPSASQGESAAPRESFQPVEFLERGSVEELLERLREGASGDARLWIQRALVEDALAPEDPFALHQSLLQGLRSAQDPSGFFEFLNPLWLRALEPAHALRLIEELSSLLRSSDTEPGLPPGLFLFWTQAQWGRLLNQSAEPRDVPASEVLALFQRVQERLGPDGEAVELNLMAMLVVTMGYALPEEWLDAAIERLLEDFSQLSEHLQEAFDRFAWVDRYRKQRSVFLAGPGLRSEIDAALMAQYAGSRASSDQMLLGLLDRINQRPEDLLASFPDPESEDLQIMLGVFVSHADTLASRMPFARRLRNRVGQGPMEGFFASLRSCAWGKLAGVAWSVLLPLLRVGYFLFAWFSAVWLIALVLGIPEHPVLHSAIVVVILTSLVLGRRYHGMQRLKGKLLGGLEKQLYRDVWRPRLVAWMLDDQLSSDILEGLDDGSRLAEVLQQNLAHDPVPYLVARVLRLRE